MQILTRQKLNIHRGYLYLFALLISCILVIQVSNANAVTSIFGVFQYALFFIANYFVWILLLDFVYGALIRFQQIKERIAHRLLEGLCSMVVLLIFHLLLTNLIYYSYRIAIGNVQIGHVWQDFQPFIIPSLLSRIIDLMVILLIIKAIEAFALVQKQRLEMATLKNDLTASQLDALRSQLDPHFLFNALHTVHTLIGYEDKKAKNMVLKITQLMRKMLSRKEEQLISFAEELDYFNNYLAIEQERFYDRLDLDIDVHHSALPFKVPALILQPLIENAFKHGISQIGDQGSVILKALVKNSELYISLSNSIPESELNPAIPSTGVGLSNLKNRLELIYKEQHVFTTTKKTNSFEVQIQLKSAMA